MSINSIFRLTVLCGISLATVMAQTGAPADRPNTETRSYEHDATGVSQTSVRQTQRQLQKDGFYHGRIDGVLGPETRSALREYQEQNHLHADGRMTRQTAESLGVASPHSYFETAGNQYSGAGSEYKHSVTGSADRFEQGHVAGGFETFGRGVWHGTKTVGQATATGAKGIYHGIRNAF